MYPNAKQNRPSVLLSNVDVFSYLQMEFCLFISLLYSCILFFLTEVKCKINYLCDENINIWTVGGCNRLKRETEQIIYDRVRKIDPKFAVKLS